MTMLNQERLIYGHSLAHPSVDGGGLDPEPAARFGKADPLLAKRDPSGAPRILSLLSLLYPGAVARFVAAIVIASFYTVVLSGTLAHVGKKSLEIITPAFADAYPPASVTIILLMTFSQASIFHILPYSMSRSSCQSMCSSYAPRHRTMDAATTSSVTSQDFSYTDNLLVSAVTAEEPARPSIAALNETQGNEMAETDAGMVFSHAASLPRWQT